MKTLRFLALLLAPALAVAQGLDSVHVAVEGGEYPGYVFSTITVPDTLGPLPFLAAQPALGCEPYTNPDEVAGSIVLVERGECALAIKAERAAEAGALAVVVSNNDADNPDDIPPGPLCGPCPPFELDVLTLFVSYNSGQALLAELGAGATEATILPIRVAPPPPPPPTVGTHDTGRVQFDVFDYGFFGRDVEFHGTGFDFDGYDGLFVGSVLVGIDGDVVSNPFDGFSEWTAVSEVVPVTPPAPFDQAFHTSFENADLGIRVTEHSYSRMGDPYVIVELETENISGSDLNDVYVGLFADFDVGTTSIDDAAGVDEDLNLVYVYDPVEDAPYFGVVAIGASLRSLSGYSADATTADDGQLFEALTTAVEIAPDPAERAVVIGVGPFDIPAGASSGAVFAFVGGSDELDMIATTKELHFPGGLPAVEETTPEGPYTLASAYPNPFASRTTLSFALPTAQEVRLAVYDVLGREVAVLADGARPAGAQAVDFDASALPSGVYLVRLEAGAARLVERVMVLR